MSLKLNTAIDFNNRWPLATLPNKKAKVVQTIILDDDDNDVVVFVVVLLLLLLYRLPFS